MNSTVLILGANGRFGMAAAHAFAAAGWTVLAQSRKAATALPRGARAVQLDLGDTGALVTVAAGAIAVVHAVNPPYTRWSSEALPLARQGMAVARALDALFMLPGNVYNFGEAMPALLHPGTPQVPTTEKGRIRVAMEAEMQRCAADGLRSVVLRAGDFYGGGSGNWFDSAIVKSLARSKLVYPGPLDVPHAWAWLPDLARAFVAVAEARAVADREHAMPPFTRLHFAGHTLTGQQLLDAVERAADSLGLRPAGGLRRGTLPWGLIRAAGTVMPLWRELARMSYLWRVPHALDGTALHELTGTAFDTPIDVALRAALVELAPVLGLGDVHRAATT
jgi:nucleoside-diphosphate-sugar epimerase